LLKIINSIPPRCLSYLTHPIATLIPPPHSSQRILHYSHHPTISHLMHFFPTIMTFPHLHSLHHHLSKCKTSAPYTLLNIRIHTDITLDTSRVIYRRRPTRIYQSRQRRPRLTRMHQTRRIRSIPDSRRLFRAVRAMQSRHQQAAERERRDSNAQRWTLGGGRGTQGREDQSRGRDSRPSRPTIRGCGKD
jgi:hypothetical protein